MRFLILVFVLGLASSSFAQEWEVVPSGDPELVCLSPGGDAEPVCGRVPAYHGCIERPAAVCEALVVHFTGGGPGDRRGDGLGCEPTECFELCLNLLERAAAEGLEGPVLDRVIVAQAIQETHFRPEAVGGVGELGIIQVTPRYHCNDVDDCDHVAEGVRHLLELLEDEPTMTEALARYNCGGRSSVTDDCFDYAAAIRSNATRLREELELLPVCQ